VSSQITDVHRAKQTGTGCPAGATLDAWVRRPWTDGVQLADLQGLDVLHVRTRNSLYHITVLDTQSGEVLIRGGRFFHEHTRVILAGSSLGGAFLKLGGIYRSFCIEVHTDVMRVVTSPVESIERVTPAGDIQ
jgi:hypothetical protein